MLLIVSVMLTYMVVQLLGRESKHVLTVVVCPPLKTYLPQEGWAASQYHSYITKEELRQGSSFIQAKERDK